MGSAFGAADAQLMQPGPFSSNIHEMEAYTSAEGWGRSERNCRKKRVGERESGGERGRERGREREVGERGRDGEEKKKWNVFRSTV